MWFPTQQTQTNKSIKYTATLIEKKKPGFGLGGLSEDSEELRVLLQGTELPLRALGVFCLKVRLSVGTVNSDSKF